MNVLIVVGGSIGERHLRCFGQVGAEHISLCDSSDAIRQQLAKRYKIASAFSAVDDATRHTWDAVVICTPAHLHVEHALALLPTTRAMLIEKPLATTLDALPDLFEAAKDKPVGVAYVMRGHPAVGCVKKLLSDGRIGALLQVTYTGGQHFPTYRPAYRDIYYARRETGGGAVQDAATHMFDLVQYLVGRFNSVYCDHGHQALEGVDVEDTVHLIARANEGRVMVSLALNQFMAPNESVLQLNGDRGSLRLHLHEHRYAILNHGESRWQWSETLVEDRDDLFRLQAETLLAAARGEGSMRCSLDDARHTLRINLAALESAGQRVVALDDWQGRCS